MNRLRPVFRPFCMYSGSVFSHTIRANVFVCVHTVLSPKRWNEAAKKHNTQHTTHIICTEKGIMEKLEKRKRGAKVSRNEANGGWRKREMKKHCHQIPLLSIAQTVTFDNIFSVVNTQCTIEFSVNRPRIGSTLAFSSAKTRKAFTLYQFRGVSGVSYHWTGIRCWNRFFVSCSIVQCFENSQVIWRKK